MDYKAMLTEARKKLPESVFHKERFEIPKIRGHLQGNRAILNNFLQIAQDLRRQPEHMLKFVLKELATPGEIKSNGTVILGAKVAASMLNDKVRKYANEFVFCKECGKPDTILEKEGNFHHLKCSACGARYPVKSKI
ncbi:TPA: translation initiation factor IF-2 subunit beta [Candidatus Woesearchaeota archaeon]|nr:translation initiation factor IF-2 subunit beta [Candidatus Woesearchaeota archaeon]HII69292.1 translation initiation factor IF-2 subunit beta [Candidatus Woesearchaeota archaeon]